MVKLFRFPLFFIMIPFAVILTGQTSEPEEPSPMTLERLQKIILEIDPEARSEGPYSIFQFQGVPLICLADPSADRLAA